MLEIIPQSYEMALENVQDTYPDTDFPDICPFADDVDELLNGKLWNH
jgi:hypothetical protein